LLGGGNDDDGEAESVWPAGEPDIEDPNGAGGGCEVEGKGSGCAATELQ